MSPTRQAVPEAASVAPKVPAPRLQDHMLGTYHSLRLGIGVLGVLLPWVLWIGGSIGDVSLQSSMSDYYHTPMRDVFVGALIAIGALLYLYKGFSTLENLALNAAGILAVGVALFPTGIARTATIHAVCAVAFFVCIAYVSIFRGDDTLSMVRDAARARRLQRTYRFLGGCMVGFPLLAVLFSTALEPPGGRRTVFFVEAAGVVAFAAYWFVKSLEMRETNADELAAQGQLHTAVESDARELPGRIVREEPETAREEMELATRH